MHLSDAPPVALVRMPSTLPPPRARCFSPRDHQAQQECDKCVDLMGFSLQPHQLRAQKQQEQASKTRTGNKLGNSHF
jgi:hypothetical protein